MTKKVIHITTGEMNDKMLDEFITRLENSVHKDENGVEFWYAREFREVLEYAEWRNFERVINKAKLSCEQFEQPIDAHFVDVNKMVKSGVAPIPVQDYKLSRYACYLIAQNSDPTKKIVAFAQTYFAVQTRRQEIEDHKLRDLSEDDRRIKLRSEIKEHNKTLASTAKTFGVIEPLDYAVFQNAGYKGLYNGKTKQDIAKHKGLSKAHDILDHMGSEELAANWFRVTQTEAQLKKDEVYGKQNANKTHFEISQKVRNTMVNKPEDLPKPQKSVKQLEKEKLKNTTVKLKK